ncbi:MAG: sigma-54-dependent Fis family transcriptional regulator [Acidobacteriaceae bacterium]|nr:sigma-54-dependent Fis family transcriptional regulator [Acidobacteriaceae bacterium]
MTDVPGVRPISIAIIDDRPASVELMQSALQNLDVETHAFHDPEQGLEFILNHHPQIVLSDLVMPGLTGMELLERVVEFDPTIDVILTTAFYSTESAVEAIRKGAADYLNKPFPPNLLRARLEPLLARHRARLEALALEQSLASQASFAGMIGNSPPMWHLYSQIQRIAPHYRTVLVTGPTGTGKELVAKALHQLGPSAAGPFVPLNCSAVVETLFESELFGHVKGAFTGATHDKVGLFEHANNGTLLLDEIGDMPLATQAKLLRTLQQQEIQRLGSLQTRKVNVRVIAATHHDLRAMIARGAFRQDLFYRLSMIELKVPSLTERDADLQLLTRHFVARYAAQFNKTIHGLTYRAQLLLRQHSWPGNVRELENVIGHACIMVMGTMIDVDDLPDFLRNHEEAPPEAPAPLVAPELSSLDEQERRLLTEALTKTGGNQSGAARLLRISRDTLRYRIKKHNLTV